MDTGNDQYQFAIEINQHFWLYDTSDEDSEADDDNDNDLSVLDVLPTKEPTKLTAQEMDRRSEEVMNDLIKAKIIFEPVINGSLFPKPVKSTSKPISMSEIVCNGSSSGKSEPKLMNQPELKTHKSKKSSQRSSLAVKQNEWRPVPKPKQFSVKLDEFPAL